MNTRPETTIPDPEIAPFQRGYVHVYTGDGKGKTTAAIGLAVRAVGAGLRVFLAQFVKSMRYSEIEALERLGGNIVCRQYGRGCWLRGDPSPEDVRLARIGYAEVREVIHSGEYPLVILDEANVATWFKLLDVEDLLVLIDEKPAAVELVFTGRRADSRLIERADLVTEMREIKHYYHQGVAARKGIES
ncbi:cob(I)yrinic acid a,c-diamide adenosyltransferase [Propionivibrio limicola]|uniref:cob(I)yrinic acid a,c-diamide adenosyltransferase n=1 Tax=Propionivibrio limicola TaxID=167645 RepID=UPI001290E816|nr:cob(I)yrinic acid a,c-diamide adenosyltransferase [Propionivibrio limicola]